jgi:hypothetical protein
MLVFFPSFLCSTWNNFEDKKMARTKKLAKSTKLGREYKRKTKGTKAGSGKRFKAMTETLEKKGAKSPKALAAWIGRRKYGAKKMAKMSAAGRKRGKGKK